MSRESLIRMARRNLEHVRAGTVDQAAGVYSVPAENYHDAERWRREMARIFGRLPLVLGFSSELREANAYRAMVVADTPILLVRLGSGELRGFLNVCSHRGARVVAEGAGSARQFVCPYHAWRYENDGALAGVYKEDQFGEVERECLGLTRIPVAERAGLVFGHLDPEAQLDIDHFLAGYDAPLEHLGLADCTFVGRQELAGPNWKIAYDGYLDFYHLPILHRESFGPKTSSDALYDAWGPHQRVSMPNPRYLELEKKPESEWPQQELLSGVWTIFPHVSIADFEAGQKIYLVSQLFPGESPETSITVQNFLATAEPDDEQRKQIEGMMRFLLHVVRDEDYATGNRIQLNVKTGAKQQFLFGRNELGGQRFHRWVDALLETADDALAARFERGLEERA